MIAGPASSTTSWPASPTRSARSIVGDPFDAATELGPGRLGRAARRVSPAWSSRAVAAGAEVADRRPGAPTAPGFFYEPTVVVGPTQDSEIVQREVFGPVVTVQRFTDEAQALAWANGVDYGLAA